MIEKRIFRKGKTIFECVLNKWILLRCGVITGKNCLFNGILTIEGTYKVRIADNVRINSGKRFNVIGGDTRTVFRTFAQGKLTLVVIAE